MDRMSSSSERETLLKTAADRLNPSITNPNFLVLRSRRRIFQKWISGLPDNPLRVLDIGGRYQPYRPLLDGRVSQYVAVDIQKTVLVDVVGNGEFLPFAPNSFDLAIATQVFEYFPRPQIAAKQIYASLKPGGTLLMSFAACTPRIVDEECWRFTPRGIRILLAPFRKIEIVPEVASLGGLLRTINLGMNHYSHFRLLRKAYEWTVCPLLNSAGLILEHLQVTKNDQFTSNYSVLAQK
jgi:SAM-dependent methyltransferase